MNKFGKFQIFCGIVVVLIFPSFCHTQNLPEAHLPNYNFGIFNISKTEDYHVITPRVQPILYQLGNSPTANIIKKTFLEVNRVINQIAKRVNHEVEGIIHRFNVNTNDGICNQGELLENWSAENVDFYSTFKKIKNIIETMQNLNHATVNKAISRVQLINSGNVPPEILQKALQILQKTVAIAFANVNKSYKEMEDRFKQAFQKTTDAVIKNNRGIHTRNELLSVLKKSVKKLENAEERVVREFHNTEVAVDNYIRSGELNAIYDLTPVLKAFPEK